MKERKEINLDIGKRIKSARESKCYTQEKLSEKIDVTTQYISDLERGVVGASISTIIKICKELNVSSDYILFGKEDILTSDIVSIRLKKLSQPQLDIINKMLDVLLVAMKIE